MLGIIITGTLLLCGIFGVLSAVENVISENNNRIDG
jgi:hypothetical protein